jgi:glycosyltransferase involved in cell wall biosynthesis
MAQGLANNTGNQVAILAAKDQFLQAERFTKQLDLTQSPTKLPLPWKAAEALWTLTGGAAVDNYCTDTDWVYCPKNDFIPLRNTRLAVTVHGAHELDPNMPQATNIAARLNRVRRRLSYQRIVERSDLVLTVSEFLKTQIIDWFGCDENKIVVVGNGVEQDYFDVAQKPAVVSGYPTEKPYLVSIGGLNEIDGGDYVLNVAKHLKIVCPELIIRVAGNQHEPELLAIAEQLDNVELLGYVPKERLALLMRDAMALLFLTRYETFGIAAIEAMAVGTPVITSGGTAVPEIIGDAGLYVSLDAMEITETTSKLLNDSELYATLQERKTLLGALV